MERRSQAGFTIIELVVVIALLGLLAAVALPKFANLRGQAQTAAFDGVRGGFSSAIAIVHAQWLANPAGGTVVTLENGTVTVDGTTGWPVVNSVAGAAATPVQNTGDELYAAIINGTLPNGWTAAAVGANSGIVQYTLTGTSPLLTFTYDSNTGTVTTP